jgi:hypothetical protein
MPLPKRRSSSGSSCTRTSGRERRHTAAHHDGRQEELALVDQPGPEGVPGQLANLPNACGRECPLSGRQCHPNQLLLCARMSAMRTWVHTEASLGGALSCRNGSDPVEMPTL